MVSLSRINRVKITQAKHKFNIQTVINTTVTSKMVFEKVKLCIRLIPVRIGCAEIKALGTVVIYFTCALAHKKRKEEINRVDYSPARAEIAVENDKTRGRIALIRRTAAAAFEKLRARVTETVNALLHIANDKQVLFIP